MEIMVYSLLWVMQDFLFINRRAAVGVVRGLGTGPMHPDTPARTRQIVEVSLAEMKPRVC